MGEERPLRILFVCLGNIIRSPLAAALFRKMAQERGVAHKYEVDSAGLGPWHVGEPADPRMRRVAARHGVVYDEHRARLFRKDDLETFDLILVMDRDNWARIMSIASLNPEHRAKIRLLREFDPEGGPNAEVPDPYYNGVEDFERVYRIVERSVAGLLDALEAQRVPLAGGASREPGDGT